MRAAGIFVTDESPAYKMGEEGHKGAYSEMGYCEQRESALVDSLGIG